MNKFQKKYLIPSIRFNVWDYSRGGKYYITIVTRGRECLFGGITNGKMHLNDIGTIVNDFWLKIPEHFKNTWLDEYVIMPNHIHGIIVMKRNKPDRDVAKRNVSERNVETPNLGVSTCPNTYPNTDSYPNPKTQIPNWRPGSLGVIINQFKRICTITIRKTYNDFGWQSRFYDEIIRNQKRLEQIRKYIRNNPANWKSDDFHI